MPKSFEKSGYASREKYERQRKLSRDRENKKKRAYINSHKQDCFFCGADKNTVNIEFHHKNPLEKQFAISHMRRMSFASIDAEIKKCWCLCEECHTKLHQRLIDPLPSAYDEDTSTTAPQGPLIAFLDPYTIDINDAPHDPDPPPTPAAYA